MTSMLRLLNSLPVWGLYTFLVAAFASYFFAMVIFPFTQGDWDYVQKVWDRWQGWNVGVLAFLSTLLAFNISRSNAEKQRLREFIGARAFLPDSLNDLHDYLDRCTVIINSAINNNLDSDNFEIPTTPSNYRNVFKECIKFGDPETADYLARILNKLQVHRARLFDGNIIKLGDPRTHRFDYFFRYYDTGELLAMLSRVFPFARGDEDLNTSKLSYGEFRTAYRLTNVDSAIEDELFQFTRDRLKNKTEAEPPARPGSRDGTEEP